MNKQELQCKAREFIKDKTSISRHEIGAYYSHKIELDDPIHLQSIFSYIVKKLQLDLFKKTYHESLLEIDGAFVYEEKKDLFDNLSVTGVIKKSNVRGKDLKYLRLSEIVNEKAVLMSDLSAQLSGLESRLTLGTNLNHFVDDLSHLIYFRDSSIRQYEFTRKSAVGDHTYQIVYQGNCQGTNSFLHLNSFGKSGFFQLHKILLEAELVDGVNL